MNTIRATVRGGRLELDVPADWPDGTEVEIHRATRSGRQGNGTPKPEEIARNEGAEKPEPRYMTEEEWSDSPEAIADWLKWYDSLEPLLLSPEEEAEAEAWLRKVNDYSIANMDKGIEDLFG